MKFALFALGISIAACIASIAALTIAIGALAHSSAANRPGCPCASAACIANDGRPNRDGTCRCDRFSCTCPRPIGTGTGAARKPAQAVKPSAGPAKKGARLEILGVEIGGKFYPAHPEH